MTSAKIILDSVSPHGVRLTTMEVCMHRFVLAEFNTHRMFSRNSASSRAIPIKKQIDRIIDNIAMPVEFGANKPGMQADVTLEGNDLLEAQAIWNRAALDAINHAKELMELGVHKQIVNRLLEPFMWHTVICTATDWDNFFGLRANRMAQPEIREAAFAMKKAYDESEPSLINYGEWHTPYMQPDEYELDPSVRKRVSAARCARVSYLTHDGVRDLDKDLELYERLTSETPPHASPLEHVATPAPVRDYITHTRVKGNFYGWHQLRHWGIK